MRSDLAETRDIEKGGGCSCALGYAGPGELEGEGGAGFWVDGPEVNAMFPVLLLRRRNATTPPTVAAAAIAMKITVNKPVPWDGWKNAVKSGS